MWKLLISLILGLPIYRGGFPRFNSLDNLLNPRPSLPRSAITRDPFWYDLGDVGLRPFWATSDLPPCLRESYLSPVKRRYLWTKHPLRPFGKFGWCHLKTANTLEMFNSSLSLLFKCFSTNNNLFRGRDLHPLKCEMCIPLPFNLFFKFLLFRIALTLTLTLIIISRYTYLFNLLFITLFESKCQG